MPRATPFVTCTVPTRLMTVVALCAAGTLTLTACASGSTSPESTATQAPSTAASSTAGTDAPTTEPGSSAGVVREAVDTQTGVAYASTSPSQTLDLYLPASDGSTAAPVVVLIHGGAFAMGDSGMEAGLAQTLVQQGFAVAAVNYRLSGEALYPAGAQDVKAAVRWLRANATEYGLDPDKFAAWGQSAGGWMATMLGVTGDQATIFDDDSLGNPDQSDAVQAVVSWYGPVDFATMDEQAADVTACAGQSQVPRHGRLPGVPMARRGSGLLRPDRLHRPDVLPRHGGDRPGVLAGPRRRRLQRARGPVPAAQGRP